MGVELAALIARHGDGAGAVLRALARAARTAGDATRLARYRRMAVVADVMTGAVPGGAMH